jgi:hypothetical protein
MSPSLVGAYTKERYMSSLSPQPATTLICPINGTAASPPISFGGSAAGNSGTGIYGSPGSITIAINGADAYTFTSSGLAIDDGQSITGPPDAYSGTASYQPIGVDLNLGAAAGKTGDTAYLSPVMGNLIGASLTKTGNYLGGLIGAFSITGTKASTYPTGAVLAQVTDGVTDVDGAVTAYIDGDSSLTTANAAFKAMSNNSTPGSGFNYGLDLQGATHDGFPALAILKADIRTASGAVIMTGGGAPTNGATGLNFAGKGSLYIDTTNGKLYITTGASSSPTWVVVGSQS